MEPHAVAHRRSRCQGDRHRCNVHAPRVVRPKSRTTHRPNSSNSTFECSVLCRGATHSRPVWLQSSFSDSTAGVRRLVQRLVLWSPSRPSNSRHHSHTLNFRHRCHIGNQLVDNPARQRRPARRPQAGSHRAQREPRTDAWRAMVWRTALCDSRSCRGERNPSAREYLLLGQTNRHRGATGAKSRRCRGQGFKLPVEVVRCGTPESNEASSTGSLDGDRDVADPESLTR